MEQKICNNCKSKIDKESEICPICGAELSIKKKNFKFVIIIIVAIFIINMFPIFFMKNIFNSIIKDEKIIDLFEQIDNIKTNDEEDIIFNEYKDIITDVIDKNNTQNEEKTTEELQKEAIEYSKSNLKYFSSSRKEIIDLLKMKGYTEEIAIYAADNCGADWNQQALGSANSYLKYSSFSYKGLIEQLEYEGFTSEQAIYAVDNCGADWNEQAVKKAESHLKYFNYTKEYLIEILEYEGFTHEQAVYGVQNNGLL